MLKLTNLSSSYGASQVLRDFSLQLEAGEVLCLLGRNGAGKTTALRSVMGLMPTCTGSVQLNGEELGGLSAHQRPRRGLGYVPQGRRLFSEMTVRENLEIGLMTRSGGAELLQRVLEFFPALHERMAQHSGTLSGGEQQMLAMARALCVDPSVILMDEPTEGLMPSMIATIRDVIRQLRDHGVGVLLVEQRVDAVLPVANRVAFVENGQVRDVVDVSILEEKPELLQKYVGVGH